MNPTTVRYSVPGVGMVADPTIYGQAKTNPVNFTPSVATPTSTAVDRTPAVSALSAAQENLATVENSRASYGEQARAYAAQQRQARIDAINQTFAPRIAAQNTENAANMSRVSALNFNKGIVGSGVDTTAIGTQNKANKEALQAIEDSKAVQINQAFTWADQLARDVAEQTYQEKATGAKANVELMKSRADTALKALDIFGSQAHSAEELKAADPNTYNTLKTVSGMSDSAIATYLASKAPEGTYLWDQAKVSGSTMYVPKNINGKVTMEQLTLPYTPTKTQKSVTKTDDGVFILYDDNTYENIVTDTKKAGAADGFTLGAGQTRYDAAGNVIATAPAANTQYTIPTPNRNNLLKQFTPTEVDQMQADVRAYGLDKVLAGIPAEQREKVRQELDATYLYSATQ